MKNVFLVDVQTKALLSKKQKKKHLSVKKSLGHQLQSFYWLSIVFCIKKKNQICDNFEDS